MFKYQVHFFRAPSPTDQPASVPNGWCSAGTYYALDIAEIVAHGLGTLPRTHHVTISQLWNGEPAPSLTTCEM